MPTPISPGVVRVQAVLQGRSGLPSDRFVSTFHFRTPSGTAEALHHATARQKVIDFYTGEYASGDGVLRPLTAKLSPAIIRGVGALEVRSYHLGDPEPREPQIEFADILGTAPTAGLPAEVAVCLSYSGERALPRSRGRVYFGPLASTCMELDATNGRVKVEGGLRNHLTAAALDMAGGTDTDPARWVVYSPTSNTSTIIRQGYVDDGFDTQRRRGEDPVDRIAFVVPAA